eukprot:TRINITY_DN91178_c0_g1_i1.p1 TRINITY_DN91178_c0_g1~~TRINITY_DN91178_c0_g1_i1.p1  ORF type:complete len:106 (+),score=4.29 TRINITY_DN91178_c0_g1_i1:81-398(+)
MWLMHAGLLALVVHVGATSTADLERTAAGWHDRARSDLAAQAVATQGFLRRGRGEASCSDMCPLCLDCCICNGGKQDCSTYWRCQGCPSDCRKGTCAVDWCPAGR